MACSLFVLGFIRVSLLFHFRRPWDKSRHGRFWGPSLSFSNLFHPRLSSSLVHFFVLLGFEKKTWFYRRKTRGVVVVLKVSKTGTRFMRSFSPLSPQPAHIRLSPTVFFPFLPLQLCKSIKFPEERRRRRREKRRKCTCVCILYIYVIFSSLGCILFSLKFL